MGYTYSIFIRAVLLSSKKEGSFLMKLVLFGTGKVAREFKQYSLRDGCEVIAICDNDSSKWGSKFGDYTVESPAVLEYLYFDFVIILIGGGQSFTVRNQLEKKGIPLAKIIFGNGPVSICTSAIDRFFIIPKNPPEVPFKKGAAEIYQTYVGETSRSFNRRKREGFFQKYCQGEGLDIGYGADLIVSGCSGWDLRNGDAQYLASIPDESFDFVYSSHCLEHMHNVRVALKNWFRVVRRGGYLIIAIPHRDLYEKRRRLPSEWNGDHKHMFLIGRSDYPDTLDIIEEIKNSLSSYDFIYVKKCEEGHTIDDPMIHSDGEYQIEIVLKKIG